MVVGVKSRLRLEIFFGEKIVSIWGWIEYGE